MNWKGDKYEENRDAGVVELAKLIRKDIAAAIADGKLPNKIIVSVRCEHGNAINVVVKSCPDVGAILNPERVIWEQANPHAPPPTLYDLPMYTGPAMAVIERLTALVNAYNYDNSEIQTDYFDRGFYEHIGFAHELEQADKAETIRVHDVTQTSGHLEAAKAIEQIFRQAYFAAKTEDKAEVSGFHVLSEAWYGADVISSKVSTTPGFVDEVTFGRYVRGDGCEYEAVMKWDRLRHDRPPSAKLVMWDDSFAMLSAFREVFDELAEGAGANGPDWSPSVDEFVAILVACGFEDLTKRGGGGS